MATFLNNPQKPKISGSLNNCALSCGLPILFSDISSYAILEKYQDLPNDNIYQAHAVFKKLFADYYNLDNTALSWKKFSRLLTAFDNNLVEQIMLTPITRLFIAQYAPDQSDLFSLKENGRYSSLYADTAFEFFFKAFEINFTEVQGEFSYTLGDFPKERTVTAYIQRDHFELLDNDSINEADDDTESIPESLRIELNNILAESKDKENTLQAFEAIKKEVKSEYNFLSNQNSSCLGCSIGFFTVANMAKTVAESAINFLIP